LNTGAGRVLVDVAATTFCDGAGIAPLLTARRDPLAHAVDVGWQVINPTGIALTIPQILDPNILRTTRTPTSAGKL
jgi:hypothetical protein